MLNKQITTVPLEEIALALNHVTARFNLEGELIIENAKGQVLETAECLAQLNKQGNLKSVLATVWVPSQLVILTEVFVPGKRTSDWMAALPYTLEESLSEPVENFHFVALHRRKEGVVSVAIVAHQWMKHWVETLQTLTLTHAQLVPDCFRVPIPEGVAKPADDTVDLAESADSEQTWNVISQEAILHVRTSLYSGFSISEPCLEPFKMATQLTGKNVAIHTLTPASLLNSQLDSDKSTSQLTLRTDDYQALSKNLKYWQDWRWPAVLIGLMVIVSLVATWQKTQTLVEQTQLYQTQAESLFKEMFPDAKRIVNIKMQTQTRLNNQEGGQKNTVSLVTLLQEIEPLFKADPNVEIKTIQWAATATGGQLQMTVAAQQTSQLQTIVSLSQQQNRSANVELELKNVTPDLVEGVFNVTAK